MDAVTDVLKAIPLPFASVHQVEKDSPADEAVCKGNNLLITNPIKKDFHVWLFLSNIE